MNFGPYPDREDAFVIKSGIDHHPVDLFHPLQNMFAGEYEA